jgi:hypothetical protein
MTIFVVTHYQNIVGYHSSQEEAQKIADWLEEKQDILNSNFVSSLTDNGEEESRKKYPGLIEQINTIYPDFWIGSTFGYTVEEVKILSFPQD